MDQGCYFLTMYCSVDLQSLMIAAIPNIIGWLAISFAKVRFSISLCSTTLFKVVYFFSLFNNVNSFFNVTSVGFFISVHGKVAGGIWCWNYLLCGNILTIFYILNGEDNLRKIW